MKVLNIIFWNNTEYNIIILFNLDISDIVRLSWPHILREAEKFLKSFQLLKTFSFSSSIVVVIANF